jgi:hypothetical protein
MQLSAPNIKKDIERSYQFGLDIIEYDLTVFYKKIETKNNTVAITSTYKFTPGFLD